MIDLNDRDVMSSTEAARRWHKADDYVRQMFRKSPEKFPEGTIRKFGKQLVVTRRGNGTSNWTIRSRSRGESFITNYIHPSFTPCQFFII